MPVSTPLLSVAFDPDVQSKLLPHVETRELVILDAKTNKVVHKVQHQHFRSWPDFGVPADDSLKAYKNMINNAALFMMDTHKNHLEKPTSQPERLLVHCKAGIGRTGTTVALVNIVT